MIRFTKPIGASLVIGCALASAAACTVQSTSVGAPDGGASTPTVDGGSGPGTTTSATCLQILDCASACPDGDDGACGDACIATGSAAAQSEVTALGTCFQQNACEDAACIEANCATELSTCLEQSAEEGGTPSTTPPPATAGAMLPDLVGTWDAVLSSSSIISLELGADGAAEQLIVHESNVGCASKLTFFATGVAVVDGTTLSVHRTEGTRTSKVCSAEPKVTEIEPSTLVYTWERLQEGGYEYLVLTSDGSPTRYRKR